MSLSQFQAPATIIYKGKDGKKEVFIRHEELGHGGFAYVYRVTQQFTNKEYAIKIISKQFLNSKGAETLEKLKNEMVIQRALHHPNIVRSKISFSDEKNYYIVLEYCPGKSVRDYLRKSEHGYLSEPETRKILRDVVSGLVYLHNKSIIHHDIKLENFIIGANGKVKIADFGLSTILKEDDQQKLSICGTTNYLSPEVLEKKNHDFKVDIWAIGVATFTMLTGQPPFASAKKEIVYRKIKNAEYYFPARIIMSLEARSFIKSILVIDPEKRPTAIELLSHPFLTKFDTELIDFYKPVPTIQKVQSGAPTQLFSVAQPSNPIASFHKVQPSLLEPRNSLQSPQKVISQIPSNSSQKNLTLAIAQASQKVRSPTPQIPTKVPIQATQSQSSLKLNSTIISQSYQKVVPPSQLLGSQKAAPHKNSQNSQKVGNASQFEKSQKVPHQSSQKVGNSSHIEKSQKIGNSSQIEKSQKVGNSSQIEKSQKVGNSSHIEKSQKVGNSSNIEKSQKVGNSSHIEKSQKIVPPSQLQGSQKAAPHTHSHNSQKVSNSSLSEKSMSQKVDQNSQSQSTQKVKSSSHTRSPQKGRSQTPSQKVRSPTPPQVTQKVRSPTPPQTSQKVRSPTPSQTYKKADAIQKYINDQMASQPPQPPSSQKKSSTSQSVRSSSVSNPRKVHPNDASNASETIRRSSSFTRRNSSTSTTTTTNRSSSSANFRIPNYFVTRFCLHGQDMGYLLGNGTVGACFVGASRIVMNPSESFVQYYKTIDSSFETINIKSFLKKRQQKTNEQRESLFNKIALVMRFAKSLKKTKMPGEVEVDDGLDPSSPLSHVKYFVTKDDSYLFKFSDKNIQVNFSDHAKMIIFWGLKKLCLVRSLADKCALLDLNDVGNMNPDCDLRVRFRNAKAMLADVATKYKL